MAAVVDILQAVKTVPACTVHPTVFFGPLAPLAFCLPLGMVRFGLDLHDPKLRADPVQLAVPVAAAIIHEYPAEHPELEDGFLKGFLHGRCLFVCMCCEWEDELFQGVHPPFFL